MGAASPKSAPLQHGPRSPPHQHPLSIPFLSSAVPPRTPPRHALFPAFLPFLSNAGRENWCEIKKKKGLSAHR